MARKPDVSAYQNFEQVVGRLDEIVAQVRDRDTSLERSLDLLDEAIALGSKAVDLVDTTDFSPSELARMADAAEASDANGGVADVPDAPDDAAPQA